MASITFTVNGQQHTVDTPPQRPLLDVLREDLKLTGTKYSCGEGQCRNCTVLVDGRPVLSCITPVSRAENKTITTIEGLAGADGLHPVQQAFLDADGYQCGYCTPGMILNTIALLNLKPNPTDQEILDYMNGCMCRCCGYPNILKAIKQAANQGSEVTVP